MPRARTGPQTRARRRKWLSAARGYWGGKSKQYRAARLQSTRAMITSYKERRRKKRVFRSLMITRINAALEPHDLSYSRFVNGLKLAGVALDRSVLSELAGRSPADFGQLVQLAASALAK